MTGPGLPGRNLSGEGGGKAIRVGQRCRIQLLIDGAEARLMRDQLSNGDVLFSARSELGPVFGHWIIEAEQAV